MKIIFFGSSGFSTPFLEAVKDKTILVVAPPDKRKNRGQKLLPNPVKIKAGELGISVLTANVLNYEVEKEIKEIRPDIFVVVSFGKIIPPNILSIPKCAINIHPSRLPLYRGAAPIERQIMDGVTESAICIIKLSDRLDCGDILVSEPFRIEPFDTKGDVERKVIVLGKELLVKAIEIVSAKGCVGIKQKGKSSYARKITKEDEIINWSDDVAKIYNKIRALYPTPGAWTVFRGKKLKIFKSVSEELVGQELNPGVIASVCKEAFVVSCGRGGLRVLEVQMEGKNRISAREFINGMHIKKGEKLG